MASIADVASALSLVSGLKVFNDGEILDRFWKDRTIDQVPFVEITENASDYTDHTSTSRTRNATVDGVLTVMREVDSMKTFRESLISAFRTYDLLHLTINGYREIGRFHKMSFTVTFFDTDSK